MLLDGPRSFDPAPFDDISFGLCTRRKDVVIMSADLSKYCQVVRVKNELPEQHLDVGMAEQNLLSVAAGVAKGGYILAGGDETPDLILIATGSEVELAMGVRKALLEQGTQARVVSMASTDVFEKQSAEYRERTWRNHVYRGIVSYDGTNYFGFQKQGEDKITIQSELERCLMQITCLDRELLCLGAAGRTDVGVHARKQVFHFYTKEPLKDELNFMRACNRLLNEDVRVVEIAKPHPMFHSRFHAIEKTYRYTIDFGLPHSPFHRTTALSVGYREYDMKLLEEACKVFVGTHDFAAFMNRSRDGKNLERNSERTIYSFDVIRGGGEEEGGERYEDPSSSLVYLYVTGNGFLYKQVRNMVGAILSVAGGRYTIDDLKLFMEKKDRKLIPMAAPAKGLCLYDVKYPDEMYFSPPPSSSSLRI